MIPSWLSLPLRLMPQPLTAVSLGVVLNLFFKRHPELRERMQELGGKIFHFHVEDLLQDFYMRVEETGEVLIHTYSDQDPHVMMAGDSTAFLALLLQMEDPDSLFFSRRLKLSGETDTGLRFKNILDNVELDWRDELASVIGQPSANLAASVGDKLMQAVEFGKAQTNNTFEDFLDRENAPRVGELADFKEAVEELTQRAERLDKAVARLQKKKAVRG